MIKATALKCLSPNAQGDYFRLQQTVGCTRPFVPISLFNNALPGTIKCQLSSVKTHPYLCLGECQDLNFKNEDKKKKENIQKHPGKKKGGYLQRNKSQGDLILSRQWNQVMKLMPTKSLSKYRGKRMSFSHTYRFRK